MKNSLIGLNYDISDFSCGFVMENKNHLSFPF